LFITTSNHRAVVCAIRSFRQSNKVLCPQPGASWIAPPSDSHTDHHPGVGGRCESMIMHVGRASASLQACKHLPCLVTIQVRDKSSPVSFEVIPRNLSGTHQSPRRRYNTSHLYQILYGGNHVRSHPATSALKPRASTIHCDIVHDICQHSLDIFLFFTIRYTVGTSAKTCRMSRDGAITSRKRRDETTTTNIPLRSGHKDAAPGEMGSRRTAHIQEYPLSSAEHSPPRR